MNKELVEIVVNKSFVELSMNEKEQLFEWCSDEEGFDQLKNVFIEVELVKKQTVENVRPSTKEKLDLLFTEKYKVGGAARWNSSIGKLVYPFDKPFHRRPIIQIAALLLLLLLAFPLLMKNKEISKISQLAKNEVREGKRKIINPITKKNHKENSVNSEEDRIISTKKKSATEGVQRENIRVESISDNREQSEINVSENSNQVSPSVTSASAADSKNQFSSDQPDGLYREVNNGEYFSKSISEIPSVLDLLSVTF